MTDKVNFPKVPRRLGGRHGGRQRPESSASLAAGSSFSFFIRIILQSFRSLKVIDVTLLTAPLSAFLLLRFKAMVRPPPTGLPSDTKAPYNSVLQAPIVERSGLPVTW